MIDISIIIPCYNYARFLRASVNSVLSQDYPNYELILIDDGSSDETWQIMLEYSERYKQVKAFRNEKNQGIFQANQLGWQKAQGEYVHFFSADDKYQPACLSKVMKLFRDYPHLALVCTDIEYFQNDTDVVSEKKLLPLTQEARIFSKNEMVPLFQGTQFWIPGLTCVVKQKILKKYGHLDPKLENISDWFCFHKIALFEGVGYIPETLISMRQHDQTYTARVKKNKKTRRATYDYLLKYLHQHKEEKDLFQKSGLLTFIFKELYWKLRFNPYYFSYWRYLKKE